MTSDRVVIVGFAKSWLFSSWVRIPPRPFYKNKTLSSLAKQVTRLSKNTLHASGSVELITVA